MADQKCSKCGATHPHTDQFFGRTGFNKSTGVRYLGKRCKACIPSGFAKIRNRQDGGVGGRKHESRVRSEKLRLGCSRCGFCAHFAALDFHHTEPSAKTASISALLRRGAEWSEVEAEMAKCVVLCANCHRIAENERKGS